uniref:CKLFlike MARVEL transmembrane domaincontaining protein 4like [Bombus impatiens] n=1 Tax=Lepeophtheirus salmonis TaxID=72036 RepID=A0A0K2UEZ2_LEPSM|nr:CKLF-like MARVEL transmembrane domain-containing protein 4 [Lepeophtheirus salmonis]
MTSTAETNIDASLRWDPTYVRTLPGILKLAQIGLNVLGFFCIIFSGFYQSFSQAEWFTFVSSTGFLINVIFVLFYCFHFIEKFHVIPWNLIEAGYAGLWGFFYLTASIAVASYANVISAFGAAAFFGFVAMVLYIVDAVFKLKGFRGGFISQHSTAANTPS